MADIIILSVTRDDHACLVDAALRALGADPALICQTTLPGGGDVSIREDGTGLSISADGARFRPSEVRAFWNRRRATAFEMPDWSHPADAAHIEENFIAALDGVAVLLDDRFAVNRISAALTTANKLNQLRQARACGLATPSTLASNDLEEIKRFAAATGPVCVKPFLVYSWALEGAAARTLTTVVQDPACLDARSVALMPALYQAYLDKAFEVRLTLFGAVVVATRINLAADPKDRADWRIDSGYLDRLEPIDPPDEIVRQCRDLLRRLDLRFGALDFVVSPTGQWTFLEVNESGQFVWQEQFCPEQRLIEPFARFLMAADPDFQWTTDLASPELSFPVLERHVLSDPAYARIRKGPASAHDRHSARETASHDETATG